MSATINKLSKDQYLWAVTYIDGEYEDDYDASGILDVVKVGGDIEFSHQRASRKMNNFIRRLVVEEKKNAISENKFFRAITRIFKKS